MIFIQQGPAWRPKCNLILEKKLAIGIIWDPRDETIERINEEKKSNFLYKNIVDIIDLKLYYKQFQKSLLKKAAKLDYFPDFSVNRLNLRDRSNLEMIVNKTIKFQLENNFEIISIPALYITSFDERLIDAIFDLILEYEKKLQTSKKLFLSIVIQENAFNNPEQMESFLNELSQYKKKIDGVYIIVDRDNASTIRHGYNSTKLANLMQFVYDLKQMKLEVIVGYCGIESANLISVGADYIATGWFYSLRKFNKEEKGLEPIEKRGKPKKRYTSIGFMSELSIDENIWQYNPSKMNWLLENALNDSSLDTKIKAENLDDISLNETYLQYFEALSKIFEKIKSESIERNLDNLLKIINTAIINVEEYNRNKLIGANLTKKHLEDYKTAIEIFASNNFIELKKN